MASTKRGSGRTRKSKDETHHERGKFLSNPGLGGLGAIAGIIGLIITLLTIVIPNLTSGPQAKQSTTGGNGNGAPSATPPFVVQPESCGALRFGADGNAGPVTCPDGRPNTAAVSYLTPMRLDVLRLGPDASPNDVEIAICRDVATGRTTFPIEASAVELATAEQNWHFGISLTDIPTIASDCKNILPGSGS